MVFAFLHILSMYWRYFKKNLVGAFQDFGTKTSWMDTLMDTRTKRWTLSEQYTPSKQIVGLIKIDPFS